MDFLSEIGNILYNWTLDANTTDYSLIINLEVPAWIFIMLLIVTFASVMSFYYGVAKNAAEATKKNYIVVFLLGLLVLWLANLIIVPTIVDNWDFAFSMNNILLSVIDTVYYAILYEIISLFAKDKSNAKHIHLLNCFS
ncbi:MAG: hypothetical protein K2H46_03465 [Muribaculaceae bacterium]|nr:hypothetical protein [Muribaculaceae bacterium]